MLVYIDDMLVSADSKATLEQQLQLVTSTITRMGFALNTNKCILEPTQRIGFLGMVIDSKEMKIYLPTHKIKECKHAMLSNLTVRQLSHLIGLLVAMHQAVHNAPLHIRALQRAKIQALRKVELGMEQQRDLQWWVQNLQVAHGRPIIPTCPQISLTSDASKTGWGGSCLTQRTGGRWTIAESRLHINMLELMAAGFTLKEFRESSIWETCIDPDGQPNCNDICE